MDENRERGGGGGVGRTFLRKTTQVGERKSSATDELHCLGRRNREKGDSFPSIRGVHRQGDGSKEPGKKKGETLSGKL